MKSSVRESFLRTKVKAYVPFGLQKLLYNYIKKLRVTKSRLKGVITKNNLKSFLVGAGLKKGDVVILHSSLGRIGYIKKGADDVIDAFLEVIGKGGTLVMPTFSSPVYNPKTKTYFFDVRKTPAYTGKIPETFRLRQGTKRSISPMHSVAAYGKNAEFIVKDHDKCDNPYAMNGPFGKLYKLGAKVFQIGVDQLANSSIHIVEDKCKFPIKVFTQKFDALAIDEKGKKRKIKFRKHVSHLYKIRKNNIMEGYMLKDKLMKIYPFGNTELRVMKVKDFVHRMEKLLKKGITIYNQ
jgi:aminoglycoside 3-N-acetyltransferase